MPAEPDFSDAPRPALAPGVVLSGLADEAGDAVETQITAHRELGWGTIELRMIDRHMVTVDLCDAAFDHARAQIADAGLTVVGVGSAIGNWSRPIDGDFSLDTQEMKLAAVRLPRLGTRFMRTMSWTRGAATEADWRTESIRRYRQLARIAQDAGLVMLHENCAGWGGQSAAHMIELVEEVGSPHVQVLFDIGNTISHGYEPWAFYQGLKGRIAYVHVKDCRRNPAGGRSADYAQAGEGHAQVREILADLLASGYRGVISIEPHIASVIHHGGQGDPRRRYSAYIDYGRRVEGMLGHLAGGPEVARA